MARRYAVSAAIRWEAKGGQGRAGRARRSRTLLLLYNARRGANERPAVRQPQATAMLAAVAPWALGCVRVIERRADLNLLTRKPGPDLAELLVP